MDQQQQILDNALDQVARLQEHVGQALDVPGAGHAAVQHLQSAQHSINHLQQLSAQLQRLATAVQQATPPPAAAAPATAAQQDDGQAAWAAGLQEQAKHAVEALQQQVTAAVCGGGAPARQLLCDATALAQPSPPPQQLIAGGAHAAGAPSPTHILCGLLHRMGAAAPGLHIHLFRSSVGRLLCSYEARRGPFDASKQPPERPGMDAAAVSHISAFVDEVRVVCPGVFVAAIALASPGRLQPVRVCVDSADRASGVDPWTNSKHQVFKRISQLATRALLHFERLEAAHALLTTPTHPSPAAAADNSSSSSSGGGGGSGAADGIALEALLLWLACFDDLFSRPCDISGRVVTWAPGTAVPLPPYVRPFWLSLEGLREAAGNRSVRKAYHAHLAPASQASTAAAVAPATWPVAGSAAAAVGGGGAGGGSSSAAALGVQFDGGGTGLLEGSTGHVVAPWDAVQFTDDQLREQLRRVIGNVF